MLDDQPFLVDFTPFLSQCNRMTRTQLYRGNFTYRPYFMLPYSEVIGLKVLNILYGLLFVSCVV